MVVTRRRAKGACASSAPPTQSCFSGKQRPAQESHRMPRMREEAAQVTLVTKVGMISKTSQTGKGKAPAKHSKRPAKNSTSKSKAPSQMRSRRRRNISLLLTMPMDIMFKFLDPLSQET